MSNNFIPTENGELVALDQVVRVEYYTDVVEDFNEEYHMARLILRGGSLEACHAENLHGCATIIPLHQEVEILTARITEDAIIWGEDNAPPETTLADDFEAHLTIQSLGLATHTAVFSVSRRACMYLNAAVNQVAASEPYSPQWTGPGDGPVYLYRLGAGYINTDNPLLVFSDAIAAARCGFQLRVEMSLRQWPTSWQREKTEAEKFRHRRRGCSLAAIK